MRTRWKGLTVWPVAVAAVLLATAAPVAGLYDTQAKVNDYAANLGDGVSNAVMNGRVAGLDTLGGVIGNEFGTFAALLLPLMGIALVTGGTRREEEAGRLELLLSARIGRNAALTSALLTSLSVLALCALLCGAVLAGVGVGLAAAAAYALALFALGAVYCGVAAVLAQAVGHARSVWAFGLGVIVATYLIRGLGAAYENALVWFSPAGWLDQVRAFGEIRWWALLPSLAAALALIALAYVLSARRDLGQALLPSRPGAPRAGAVLRSRIGTSLRDHRGATFGWLLGAVVLMGAYGVLTREVLDSVQATPDVAAFFGSGELIDAVLSTFLLLGAVLACAYAVQSLVSLRREEVAGRLEMLWAGTTSRLGWLGLQLVIVGVGALVVLFGGALALGGGSAAVLDDDAILGRTLRAALGFVPMLVLFLGVCVALFGLAPRLTTLAWVPFGLSVFVALLGPGLDLPARVIDASGFGGLDVALGEAPDLLAVVVVTALGLALGLAGFLGLRRRDVPVL